MPHLAETASYLAGLRERATVQLSTGLPRDLSRSSTSEAMAVLYQLASSPATAGDALALLHELQVHQVEVDMQHEELRFSRAELEASLARQTSRVEQSPAGLMLVDHATVLHEINPAGARLVGGTAGALLGRALNRLLSAASAEHLQDMLAHARNGAPPEACELTMLALHNGAPQKLLCSVGREASSDCFLLVVQPLAVSS